MWIHNHSRITGKWLQSVTVLIYQEEDRSDPANKSRPFHLLAIPAELYSSCPLKKRVVLRAEEKMLIVEEHASFQHGRVGWPLLYCVSSNFKLC